MNERTGENRAGGPAGVRAGSDGAVADHETAGGPEKGRQDQDHRQGVRVLARGPRSCPHGARPFELEFRDQGHTAIVLAGGPTAASCTAEWREQYPVVAVNDGYRLAPDAACCWAADRHWWDHHRDLVAGAGFTGRKFCADERYAQAHGLEFRFVDFAQGLSRDWWTLAAGGQPGNSGAQALNLAYLAGARRLLLFGFDMGRPANSPSHWFGEHPKGVGRESPYRQFIAGMYLMASELVGEGVQVLNCSPSSELPYFPRLTPAQAAAICARS